MTFDFKPLWRKHKLPVITACLVVCVLLLMGYQRLTAKDAALYAGFVNVSVGEDRMVGLTQDFLTAQGLNPEKTAVITYSGLYLTDDTSSEFYTYSHASSVKILGSIEAKKLDVVLMNKEAFDAFAQNGYLADLEALLPTESPLAARLVPNIVILEDNIDDVVLDPSVKYSAVTEEFPMALDVTDTKLFTGLDGTVYLGIIANSPRLDMAQAYLQYLFKE